MRYGDNKTIHRSGEVNVELDKNGKVVSVWFRCLPLRFTQDVVEDHRAEEMKRMYETPPWPLTAVIVDDSGG
jgi:hypothetical protein